MEIRNLLKGAWGISCGRRWKIDEKDHLRSDKHREQHTDVTGARGWVAACPL